MYRSLEEIVYFGTSIAGGKRKYYISFAGRGMWCYA